MEGMEFVLIPAGTFMMGSPPDELGRWGDELLHKVTISKPFFMQTTPVTQAQWKDIMWNNSSRFFSFGDAHPVENVSWHDSQEFIARLNKKENTDKYRLPTEAEWEYAARAGSTTAFANGDITEPNGLDPNLDKMGWFKDNSNEHTHSVGQKQPNAWGLYDMHGNVWEWCQDWLESYEDGSMANSRSSTEGIYRVLRGGSWISTVRSCRSAFRFGDNPHDRSIDAGFRLVKDIDGLNNEEICKTEKEENKTATSPEEHYQWIAGLFSEMEKDLKESLEQIEGIEFDGDQYSDLKKLFIGPNTAKYLYLTAGHHFLNHRMESVKWK